jgi:hypothetical protein
MNYISSLRYVARMKGLGAILIAATLFVVVSPSLFISTASAAQLTFISATASSSAASVSTSYTIRFTTSNGIGAGLAGQGSTTRITFDPTGNAFSLATLATATDISISGGVTYVSDAASCTVPTTNEIYVELVGRSQPEDFVQFRSCPGDTIPAGAMVVNLANAHVTNPSSTGSYVLRIGGGTSTPMLDAGDTRIAIIDTVTVTASVDTNLTFTIAGVASGTPVNGDTTSTSTTATVIGFGTLSVGTSSIAAQDLAVSTNAVNGFSVTVIANQNLTASNGADIDAFRDGGGTASATSWFAPASTIGQEATYGHFGITSEDISLPGGDEFGLQLWAGDFATTTRTVLYHTGVANGLEANTSATRVGYRVQVGSLQEAGTDYTNRLTYVCTPIF